MATEAQYQAEFNNLRSQKFWSGFSDDQIKILLISALNGNGSGNGGGASITQFDGNCWENPTTIGINYTRS